MLAAGGQTQVLTGRDAEAVLREAAEIAGIVTTTEAAGSAAEKSPVDPEKSKARILEILDGPNGWSGFFDDPSILADLARLEMGDGDKFAAVVAWLRSRKGFAATIFKTGMRPHREAAKAERRRRGFDRELTIRRPPEYRDEGDRIVLVTESPEGKTEAQAIAMFSARIVEVVSRDDGSPSPRKTFKIRARAAQGDRRERVVEIPARSFERLEWVVAELGPDFRMEPGSGVRDHVRNAIQVLSANHVETTTYIHTGWRKLGDEWAYLHAGGAIRAAGNDPSVSVDLDGPDSGGTRNYRLPDPPSGAERCQAIRASLGMFRLECDDRPGSNAVAATCFAATYRAALDYVNFSIQMYGVTGSMKSSTAALPQQHYGPAMDYRNFPSSWATDTPKSIGDLLNRAHGVAVVDDFVARGLAKDISDKHSEAQWLFQSVGNHKGRQRLNSDGTPQPDKPPNCLPISTGEDRVRGASADARTLPIRFTADDPKREILGTINKAILAECQADANAGLYAAAMAAFIRCLAPQLDQIRAAMPARLIELRALYGREGDHGRTPDIVADLVIGAETFLRFAVEVGAITRAESDDYLAKVEDGLAEATAELRADLAEEPDAGDQYINLIVAALSSGKAYLANKDTDDVTDGMETVCGWHQEVKPQAGVMTHVWTTWPNAERIGWVDGSRIYLQPENAYSVVRRHAEAQGTGFAVSKQMVHKLLHDSGRLAPGQDSRNKNDGKQRYAQRVSIKAAGKQMQVLVMEASLFWPEAETCAEAMPEAEESL